MSYSMTRRSLGQTAPETTAASAEDRRALPPMVTAALVIGVMFLTLNLYARDTVR